MKKTDGVDWEYYDQYREITEKYVPDMGQGETMATQTATALCRLIYKWYNDGDVYDNQHSLRGWCNDLSDAANWLHENIKDVAGDLERIFEIWTEDEYMHILKDCADKLFKVEVLEELDRKPSVGDIFDCDGPFIWKEDSVDDDY